MAKVFARSHCWAILLFGCRNQNTWGRAHGRRDPLGHEATPFRRRKVEDETVIATSPTRPSSALVSWPRRIPVKEVQIIFSVCRRFRVEQERDSIDMRRNLLEELQPLAAHRVLDSGETGVTDFELNRLALGDKRWGAPAHTSWSPSGASVATAGLFVLSACSPTVPMLNRMPKTIA